MSYSWKKKTLFASLVLLAISAIAQGQSLKEHLQKGDRFYDKKDYAQAIGPYLEALRLDENDAQTTYRTGIAYLNLENYAEAVTFLNKAYSLNPEVTPEIEYHLGNAYQQNLQFLKAKEHFEGFKQKNRKLSGLADSKIRECVFGDSLMKIPAKGQVTLLESPLNTSFSEFSPLITADGQGLIFTSNRSNDSYQVKSSTNFEDVYVSRKTGGQWAEPEKIGAPINVKFNDAAASLSADGKTLFLYYEDGAGDIYTSSFENGNWQKPVPLNQFINHPQYRESSACVSPDGKKLYFSSNRPGGKGGFDIYVCELGANGQWGRPSNLGSAVNTRQNEESPFLHIDGETLYFSSNGHATLGSNDIFRTRLRDGKWSVPENLGFPVNSGAYDGYFTLSNDGLTGYFSSQRSAPGSGSNIYQVSFRADAPVAATAKSDVDETPAPAVSGFTNVLRGVVIDESSAAPLDATVSLVNHATKEIIARATTDATGNFAITIPGEGNYGLTTQRPGYLFNSMNFVLPPAEEHRTIDTHILMVRATVGSKTVLKNIFFDVNQHALKPESFSELENIRELLNRNPGWRIQINGHTDNVGSAEVNQALSLKRAQSVVQHLVEHGIAPERLQARGFGASRPLVSNDDEEEGRQINRRTEIEIVE